MLNDKELAEIARQSALVPGPVFCGECTDCGWTGPPVSTIEEAMRDADAHQCPSTGSGGVER